MKKIVVLSGAGISAESGIKTFRDSDGLWEGHDVMAVATPEGWQLGDKVIIPPPQTAQDAEKRSGEGYEYTDWYFSKKDL